MDNHLLGQPCFLAAEIQQGKEGSPLARPQIGLEGHGDSKSLQARDKIGMEEVPTGWMLGGYFHEKEGRKDI